MDISKHDHPIGQLNHKGEWLDHRVKTCVGPCVAYGDNEYTYKRLARDSRKRKEHD